MEYGKITVYGIYLKKQQTPYNWHKKIFNYCKKLKIKCFSSAFDQSSIELLEKLNCPIYKIASFEMTDFSLLYKISNKKTCDYLYWIKQFG